MKLSLNEICQRLLKWDHFDAAADGSYWRREIEAALAASGTEPPVKYKCAHRTGRDDESFPRPHGCNNLQQAQPEPEDALLYPFETWAQGQGLDPNGDVAYHYAKAGWDAALRAVSQPTREQITGAIRNATLDWANSDDVRCRDDQERLLQRQADAVLALYGKSEAKPCVSEPIGFDPDDYPIV